MLDASISNNAKLEFTANLYLFLTMRINSSENREGSAPAGVKVNIIYS